MKTKQALEIIKIHQAWRRDETDKTFDEMGFTSKELGEAIDTVIKALEERYATQKWAGVEK